MIKLQVIGNIGQDARIYESNGQKSINFSVAHNRKYTDKDGVITEQTTWLSCSYWRRDGSSVEVAKYLTVGTRVFVEGIPSIGTYQSKEGKTVAGINLSVSNIELLQSKEGREIESQATEPGGQKENAGTTKTGKTEEKPL